MLAAIQRAGTAGLGREPVERSLEVAGRHVQFLFPSDDLADRLTTAFAHLPHPSGGTPALTVSAWDTATSGGPPPPLPGDVDPLGPMWRRVLVEEGPLHAVYKPGPRTMSIVDRAAGRAWYWCADAGALPAWELGTPFLHVLHHWLSANSAQLVHAGAVGDADGGVLFVGPSGSGKSTSTLACVHAGMRYAGDDYVAVTTGAAPVVHAVYSSGKLDANQSRLFPALWARVINPRSAGDEKHVFFLADADPAAVATRFALRAVVLPKVTGRDGSVLRPTSAAAALRALAPSTIFQMPGSAEAELAAIAAVVRGVPSYVLEAGTDLPALAASVRELLDEMVVHR